MTFEEVTKPTLSPPLLSLTNPYTLTETHGDIQEDYDGRDA